MLTIGSIVYLKEGSRKIMILNVGPVIEHEEKQVFFDYSGALYPQGLSPDEIYYFNHSDIDEVVFSGYEDDESKRFVTLYEQWVDKNSEFERGEAK